MFNKNIYFSSWLYLANKKQIQATLDKNNEREVESRINEAPEKGMDNKAYEADETTNASNEDVPEENNDVQSQIEIGFTESMICNSKLQH